MFTCCRNVTSSPRGDQEVKWLGNITLFFCLRSKTCCYSLQTRSLEDSILQIFIFFFIIIIYLFFWQELLLFFFQITFQPKSIHSVSLPPLLSRAKLDSDWLMERTGGPITRLSLNSFSSVITRRVGYLRYTYLFTERLSRLSHMFQVQMIFTMMHFCKLKPMGGKIQILCKSCRKESLCR